MRTAPALLIVLALSMPLTGCMTDDDPIVVDPSPSLTPIFESDEEALAAAEAAYGEYLAVSDLVLNEGGNDPERLLAVASEALFEDFSAGMAAVEEKGWHGTGFTLFDSPTLQSHYPDAQPGELVIAIYVCLDLSNVDVVDANGASVVSPSRIDRSPYEVGFALVESGDPSLLVLSDNPWDGDNFCAA